jgi:hypothetical protein
MTEKVQLFGTKILWNNQVLSCDGNNSTCYDCNNSMNTAWENKCSYVWAVNSSKFKFGYTAVSSDDKDGYNITYISHNGKYMGKIKVLDYSANSVSPMQGGIVGGCLAKNSVNTMYFAMFGGYPVEGGSGLVKIKDPLKNTQQVDWFPLMFYNDENEIQEPNIYNCYQFYLGEKWLTFAAVLGPFYIKDSRGFGLMNFDTNTNTWQENPFNTCLDLSVRSAKQLVWNKNYENKAIVLTQNYAYNENNTENVEKTETQICILNWKYPDIDKNKDQWWEIETSLLFETPIGSEGGADVILGGEPNTFWATLRSGEDSNSSLIFLKYSKNKLRLKRTINLKTQEPRYITFIKNDLYICNEADESLQIIKDLKFKPMKENLNIVTFDSSDLQDIGNIMYIQSVM